MNVSALCSSIIVVYPLKMSLSSDNLNVKKGVIWFSETIGYSRNFCCFHPLKIGKKIVFDNLILHPHYRRIKGNYAVSTLDFVLSVNHDNWTHSTHSFLHA